MLNQSFHLNNNSFNFNNFRIPILNLNNSNNYQNTFNQQKYINVNNEKKNYNNVFFRK